MFGSDGHGHSHGPGGHDGHGHSHGPGGHSHEDGGMNNAFSNLFSSSADTPRMPGPPFTSPGDMQRPSLTPQQIMQMRMQMMQHMQQMMTAGGAPGSGPQFPIPLSGPDGMPRMPMLPGASVMGPGAGGFAGGPPSGIFAASPSPPPPTDAFQFSPWPNQDAPPTSDSSVPTTSQLLSTTPTASGDAMAPATLPSTNVPERMTELVRATQFGLFDKYVLQLIYLNDRIFNC